MNKKREFAYSEILLSEAFKALAHPARLALLKTVAERRGNVCGEIVEVTPLAQATVSQHLMELKKAGYVQGQINGKRSNYKINWEMIDRYEEEIREFFDVLQSFRLSQDKNSQLMVKEEGY